MTIWVVANGESLDGLTTTGTPGTSGNVQSPYSRLAYSCGGGAADELTASLGAQNRIWHKHYLIFAYGGGLRTDGYLRFYDGGGNERLRFTLLQDPSGLIITVATVNAGVPTTIISTAANKPFYAQTSQVTSYLTPLGDFTVDINYTAGGWVRVYRDSELVGSFEGDPRVGGSTELSSAKLRSPRTSSTWGSGDYSQILFGDEDVRNVKPVVIYPNAAGTTNTATGAYTAVDESGEAGSDYVEGTAAGQKFTFNMLNLNASLGTVTVRSVWFRARIQGPDGTTPTNYKITIRTNGAEYSGTPTAPPAGVWTLVTYKCDVNPNTGVAWTNALVDAVELGGTFEA